VTFAPTSPVGDKSSLGLGSSAILITIHGFRGTVQPLILHGSGSRLKSLALRLLALEDTDSTDRPFFSYLAARVSPRISALSPTSRDFPLQSNKSSKLMLEAKKGRGPRTRA
jgi:hypothetical protein